MPRVLILYDVEGWAWWHKAHAIARHMPPDIVVNLARAGRPLDHAPYGYVVFFGDYMLRQHPQVPAKKILLGLSTTLPEYAERHRAAAVEGRVRAVFANSAMGYRLLAGAGSVFNCPNGVDAEFFCPGPTPPGELAACWVGNPDSEGRKGFDLIQEACAAAGVPLVHNSHNATGGDTANIWDHVRLRDDLYRRSGAYICASQYEGTPNPALEALACGLPVLTTPVGNMPELIRDGINGFFIERNVAGIRAGLDQLRAADRTALGRAARQSILDGWTWPQQVQNYRDMILTLAREDGLI